MASQTLVEREAELDLLTRLLHDVSVLGGRVVLVRGEAGIGKTALVREFVDSSRDLAHVHIGWCDDLITPQTFGPFWDMARSENSLSAALEREDRMAILDVLIGFLSRDLRPSVMVIEDTQWADEATCDAVKYLGRRISDTNGVLVLTFRDSEVDLEHPLRVVIGEISPEFLIRIQLKPLSEHAVAELAEGAKVDPGDLLTLTGGNPLYVTELLRSETTDVPVSVQDSVLARVAKLSHRGRETVELVSVVPGATASVVVDDIVGAADAELGEGVRQGLIHVGETLISFKHELARNTVEGSLTPVRRRELNEQVLASLMARPELGKPARLVHHAVEAGDVEAIVEHAPRAAREAMAVDSLREAVAHFRSLEPYLGRLELKERAAVLGDWARCELHLYNYPKAISTLTKAIDLYGDLGDDVGRAGALTFSTRIHEVSGAISEADRCLSEAIRILQALPPSPELAFAVSQQAWVFMMRGDDRGAVAAADRAMSVAEQTGAERALINALNTKGTALYRQGEPSGMELLEEAVSRSVETGNAFEEVRALHNMTNVAMRQRQLALAHDLALRTIEAEKKHKLLPFAGQADLVWVLAREGNWSSAEQLAEEILDRIHPDAPLVKRELARVLGHLDTRRGRPQARAKLEGTWAQERNADQLQFSVYFAAALAECMWVASDVDAGHVTEFRQLLDEVIQLGNIWDTGELALWLWKMGKLDAVPDQIADPYRLIMTGGPLAAADMWAQLGYPYERAIALSHGDTNARLQGLAILDDLGATAVADKLRQELRDEGVSVPRRRTPNKPGVGLTARQSEVLALVAQDLSNAEIADRLFLSPRTVEHHVAAIMDKLDAPTRQAAVTKADKQGALSSPERAASRLPTR